MYFTQIYLNPQSRRVRKEIADIYQLHRSILRAFPENMPDSERVLFRLEDNLINGGIHILVQSSTKPDWSWLLGEEGEGYLLRMEESNPSVKEFSPKFKIGQRLFFRLKANPSVKRNGKRWGLQKEEDQLDWLKRKAALGGFIIEALSTSNKNNLFGNLYRNEERHSVRILTVQFDGVLMIDDKDKFTKTIQQGVGSGKGFGCGLLSVAKLQ
jgi:CRISPR system Cascade subunit CasE